MRKTDYAKLPTEKLNARARGLARMSASAALRLMDAEDAKMLGAVRRCGPAVAKAVEVITARLSLGGRLFFIGAGTSGRLGVLEAAECPPTFGTPPELIQAFMAGGKSSVFRSKEGAEDQGKDGAVLAREHLRKEDVLVGVTASGVTAFVQAALKVARRKGAATILVTCNPAVPKNAAGVVIAAGTGAEVIAGSTRMKAGTATKILLNRLTTLSMVRLGRTDGPYMAHLQPRSKKLVARALRLVKLGVRPKLLPFLLIGASMLLGPRPVRAGSAVKTGLDVLESHHFAELRGKRVGVIVNRASVDRKGRGLVELLAARKDVTLAAVFTPEHGYDGDVPAGRRIRNGKTLDGVKVYSLYGETLRPSPETLQGLDVLVFDLQDAGARFYTYITTMGYAMEEAGKAGVDFMVLDRPNPLGGEVVEGEILDTAFDAFTGHYPIPVRHGLTVGELARMHAANTPNVRLTVVPMEGWRRDMLWEETGIPFVPPSPNIRTPTSALLYAGLGAFEATNLAVGRGGPAPFLEMSAAWLDAEGLVARLNKSSLPGFAFRAEGKDCVRVIVMDPRACRPVDLFVYAAWALRDLQPKEFQPRWEEMPVVTGSEEFRKLYETGAPAEQYISKIRFDALSFSSERDPFLLYR